MGNHWKAQYMNSIHLQISWTLLWIPSGCYPKLFRVISNEFLTTTHHLSFCSMYLPIFLNNITELYLRMLICTFPECFLFYFSAFSKILIGLFLQALTPPNKRHSEWNYYVQFERQIFGILLEGWIFLLLETKLFSGQRNKNVTGKI